MDPSLLPKDYKPVLPRKDAALAADAVKQFMEDRLRSDLNLFKHTSPLAFVHGTGMLPTDQFIQLIIVSTTTAVAALCLLSHYACCHVYMCMCRRKR